MQIKKRDVKYYGAILAILIMIILVEIFKEKPLDWTFYAEYDSKDPYGTYVLYKALPDLFDEIDRSNNTLYQKTRNDYYFNTNFLFITNSFAPQETDSDVILDLAEAGNNIFISAFDFQGQLADSLKLELFFSWRFGADSADFSIANKQRKDSVYRFGGKFQDYYFTSFDTLNTEVLAMNESEEATFIRTRHGDGYIYLHSQPDVFTNYAMITENNAHYAYALLSHLPQQNLIWDSYYKPYKTSQYSPLRFVFRNEALLYAWYVLLTCLILYMIFTAKRTQRIIPVIEPLKNTSAEFVETLGSLYYHTKNHRQIAINKIHYFTHEISETYFIPQNEISKENIQFLRDKTLLPDSFWKELFQLKEAIEQSKTINSKMLIQLNTLTEKYYRK